ncbi:MAG: prolyl oligopeptidase family serine peptidase [Granulicatella sp.]|nr:prolyl oligopeptidase family serine peptidase [Granulicatella sp.]
MEIKKRGWNWKLVGASAILLMTLFSNGGVLAEETSSNTATTPTSEVTTPKVGEDSAASSKPKLEEKGKPNFANRKVTKKEAVLELLQWADTSQKLIGQTESDQLRFAESLGLIQPGEDISQVITEFDSLVSIAQKLHDAYRSEKKSPLFLNGKAQPIFPYSTGQLNPDEYSFDKSDIVRFPVFVETDYDTDGDGKRDLVKAIVQMPKAVAQGDYKASTIFEARPYVAGTLDENHVTLESHNLPTDGTYDMSWLRLKPKRRVPAGVQSTLEAAKNASSSSWYYYNEWEGFNDYEDLNWYDYFLIRGYVFVSSAGLGTKESEGYNTVGSDLEIGAFKNIIQWINGKRRAYTDRENNIEIKADWANGNVGMTGLSWAGTSTFGVGATGVQGLKTIVPAAGIASWYDYFNSQGTPYSSEPFSNLSWLSIYVTSRMFEQADWYKIWNNYSSYINQLNHDQNAHEHFYSDVWKERDYTVSPQLKVPALLVHGLNDDNVKTKHVELMYQALKKAGVLTKMYLHQGDHVYPAAMSHNFGIQRNGQDYYDLLNEWFSHFLYNVDNKVESLPPVMVQDNNNVNHWTEYSSWESEHQLVLKANNKEKETVISSDYASAKLDKENRFEKISRVSSKSNASYAAEVSEDVTIKGNIPVTFKGALEKGEGHNFQMFGVLMDVSDEEFNAVVDGSANDTGVVGAFWQGGTLQNLDVKNFKTAPTKQKVIAKGWINLASPNSKYESSSSTDSIEPKVGEFHEYTMYLQPNVYKVEKGHRLVLVLNPYDLSDLSIEKEYQIRLQTESIQAVLPVVEKDTILTAYYLPGGMVSEKGKPAIQPELPEGVVTEKGEPEVRPELPDGVITEKGEPEVLQSLPKSALINKWIYDEKHQKWFYFQQDGQAAKNTWKDDYYLKKDGTMAKNEWIYDLHYASWYYLKQDGKYARNEWLHYKNQWYYLDNTGAMETGWVKVSNQWYYLSNTGAMETGWVKVSNQWYYLSSTGAMETGWVKVSNQWYYLSNTGAMEIGWVQVKSSWYYLNKSGALLTNTVTPDGYRVNRDGVWVK